MTSVGILSLLALSLISTPSARADFAEPAKSALSARHRLLLVSARDLAETVAERVWPGWSAEMEVLLLTGEREVLAGSSRRPEGFAALGEDPELGALSARPRAFPPSLLATMPAFGPPPTIVVGTPAATDRGASAWLLALLHEHFHQWQMGPPEYYVEVAALDLAEGDTTGRWMLEYPFPYDDVKLGEGLARSSRELAALLRRPAGANLSADAARFWRAFRRLRSHLSAPDGRYLDFQLWQEGVARFVELRAAEEAAARWRPPAALRAEADFEDFAVLARVAREDLLAALETPDLAGRRRVSFYTLGAGMALLLERTEPGWKRRVTQRRFVLAPASRVD